MRNIFLDGRAHTVASEPPDTSQSQMERYHPKKQTIPYFYFYSIYHAHINIPFP